MPKKSKKTTNGSSHASSSRPSNHPNLATETKQTLANEAATVAPTANKAATGVSMNGHGSSSTPHHSNATSASRSTTKAQETQETPNPPRQESRSRREHKPKRKGSQRKTQSGPKDSDPSIGWTERYPSIKACRDWWESSLSRLGRIIVSWTVLIYHKIVHNLQSTTEYCKNACTSAIAFLSACWMVINAYFFSEYTEERYVTRDSDGSNARVQTRWIRSNESGIERDCGRILQFFRESWQFICRRIDYNNAVLLTFGTLYIVIYVMDWLWPLREGWPVIPYVSDRRWPVGEGSGSREKDSSREDR